MQSSMTFRNRIISFLFFILCNITGYSQNYEALTDATGYDYSTSEINGLETQAARLNSIFGFTSQQCKVYTFGYYVHSSSAPFGTLEARQCANQVATSNNYFMLIGKVLNKDGNFERFDVTFNFPTGGAFACFNDRMRSELENLLNTTAFNLKNTSPLAFPSPENIVKEAADYFEILKNCPSCATQNGDICFKSSFEGIDKMLLGLGFRKTSTSVVRESPWPMGEDGIFDYVQKELKIDGGDYHIPDQIVDSKRAFEAGAIVTNEDTTMAASGINGRVYIFKNENFANGDWDGMQAIAASVDYVECWVLLKDSNNQYWLYSRFSFGAFSPPTADGGSAVRGENSGSRSAALSPWGAALKLLGNAAIDACLQAVGNRLTDENINNWTSAFKSVNYMGATWEGISSLLPWKKSKAASTLMTAIGKGFIVVVSKATSDQSYTAEEGLRDFLWAIGESVLSQIIGEKLAAKIPQAISGLVRFVGNSSGTSAKIGAKCFSTNLMKYGCFTGSIPVYTSLSSQKLIKDVALHDIVLSQGSINKNNSADVDLLSINEKNTFKLNAVSFVSQNGTHSCQLSLNDASLVEYEIRAIGDSAFLSIPEQGIDGIYTVTDIRKINPPKIPDDDNLADDFVLSPVTAIFAHTSDDVWKLTFEGVEEVEVTSMHPFMDAVSETWRPVTWLNVGDAVKTKEGVAVLTSKDKLDGIHTVYNFTVEGTHNYHVGNVGYLVHNSCGDLDKLADRVLNDFSTTLKKNEIATWWAKGFPGFFIRGTFFERLVAKSKFYSGWKLTHHSFKLVDFIKVDNNKLSVISMKTTNTTNVNTWISNNRTHLKDLEKGQIKDLQGSPFADHKQLDIFISDTNWNESLRDAWVLEIKKQFKEITLVRVTTIEKALKIN